MGWRPLRARLKKKKKREGETGGCELLGRRLLGCGEEERGHDLLFWLLRRWDEKEEGQLGWVGEREKRVWFSLFFQTLQTSLKQT
jgi:hypothetical protein